MTKIDDHLDRWDAASHPVRRTGRIVVIVVVHPPVWEGDLPRSPIIGVHRRGKRWTVGLGSAFGRAGCRAPSRGLAPDPTLVTAGRWSRCPILGTSPQVRPLPPHGSQVQAVNPQHRVQQLRCSPAVAGWSVPARGRRCATRAGPSRQSAVSAATPGWCGVRCGPPQPGHFGAVRSRSDRAAAAGGRPETDRPTLPPPSVIRSVRCWGGRRRPTC